ncbi:unnamed protein product [Lasius platythorax]|uniref:Uncharacterized protein n=1 Tax=Lasius platythorax TaxID=488582 RepID=A0AAV2N5W8_9HYME
MKNILQSPGGRHRDSQPEGTGNIRHPVSAETSIPRIEYGPDGEHQRQYDRGYPPSWIETAPPRDGNRIDDAAG